MKKLLLSAIVALVASTASAQLLNKPTSPVKQTKAQSCVKMKSLTKAPVVMMPMQAGGPAAVLQKSLGKELTLTPQELKYAKAARKAAELQAVYDGYGKDYESGENVTWKMHYATNDEGDTFLVDVVPNPTNIEEGLPVEINQMDAEVVIDPQVLFSFPQFDENGNPTEQMNYVFIGGNLTEDSSIHLTLGEDGSLATGAGEEIYLLIFDENKFDPEFTRVAEGGHYVGWFQITENIQYLFEGQTPKPMAAYEPQGLPLNMTMTPDGQWYGQQFTILPAGQKANFTNLTDGMVDAYAWSLVEGNETPITATTKDFSFTPKPFTRYTVPELVASYQGAESAPFQWSTGTIFGSGGTSVYLEDGDDVIVTAANLDYNIASYSYLGTPDVNSAKYSFSNLIIYQGKPTAPIYCTGISLYVRNFVKNGDVDLKCKIMKATRAASGKLELGDLIAESQVNMDEAILTEDGYALLIWNDFKELDDYGFETPIEELNIHDEFAIVFEGWDNGTFSCYPIGEYSNKTAKLTSTYAILTGTEDVVGFQSMFNRMWVGYVEAMYGYLYTEDDTTVTIPAEGGSKSIHIEPMFYSVDEETGEPTTGLWTEEDENPEYVFPEWIGLEVANEAYTETDYGFDLVVSAEALPEGVDGRMETINLYQWGAKLTLTVVQGTPSGIVEVSGDTKKAANNHIYTLSGQRVNKAQKGVYIIGGKKQVVK